MWLLDRDALGGEDHRTTLHTTPLLCNDDQAFDAKGVWGAMAAWQDARGVQWVLVPFWGPVSRTFRAPIEYGRPKKGGVAAYKLEETSPEVAAESRVAVARHGHGRRSRRRQRHRVRVRRPAKTRRRRCPTCAWNEPDGPWVRRRPQSHTSVRRIPDSRHATLYALDAQTGKELWSSGNEITSWNHFSGLTVANGRAYIGTFDGTMYSFGVPAAAGK